MSVEDMKKAHPSRRFIIQVGNDDQWEAYERDHSKVKEGTYKEVWDYAVKVFGWGRIV